MKKRNLKKLQLNKKAISSIQDQSIYGGDVSLPNPETRFLCDLTGENYCVSWNACNTLLANVTCIFTGPTKPTDTIAVTQNCGTTMNTNCHTTNVGC